MGLSLDDLVTGLAAGERPALARALSLAERDPSAAAVILQRLGGSLGRAHVVGITGPPGAGKSTLVGVMVREFLERGRRVAVLAVDPSSPLSGGALLGDRFRIGESAPDDRSFIRSTASRGSLGGLTRAAGQMVALMDAAGFDLVLVETVGTGQSEVDVAALADSLLVAFPPGLGDELQAIKAGILELADLLVVTKSDTPAAGQALQALQASAPMWRKAPPIYPVSAMSGEGVAALVDVVLVRARSKPKAARGVVQAQPQPLADEFEKLKGQLAGLLPFDQTALISMQAVSDAPDGISILCSLRPGGDSLQLGTAAGAMIGLAAGGGLQCRIMNLDQAGGRLELLLARAAGS
jgi:LAO/AO transport system ATPase